MFLTVFRASDGRHFASRHPGTDLVRGMLRRLGTEVFEISFEASTDNLKGAEDKALTWARSQGVGFVKNLDD